MYGICFQLLFLTRKYANFLKRTAPVVARLVIQWLSNIVLLQHVHVLFSNHFWRKADIIYVRRQKMNCLNKKECVQRQEQSLITFLFLNKKLYCKHQSDALLKNKEVFCQKFVVLKVRELIEGKRCIVLIFCFVSIAK